MIINTFIPRFIKNLVCSPLLNLGAKLRSSLVISTRLVPGVLGYLQFTWEKPEIWLENKMICDIPFGKLQETWDVI